MEHHIKINESSFEFIKSGHKKSECRSMDRCYRPGDFLFMQKCSAEGFYGSVLSAVVTHVQTGKEFGIMDGYGVLSIAHILEYESVQDAIDAIITEHGLNIMCRTH